MSSRVALRLVAGSSPPESDPGNLVQRRLRGDYDVDPWGLDRDLVELLSPAFGVRYDIEVDHPDRVPATGAALLVANQRFGLSEPFVLGRGVRLATGRHVRCAGVPDVQPVGSALRRLGGVLARPDEIAGLMRAGHLTGVLLARDLLRRRAGAVPWELFAPAFELGVPVVPVALVGRETGRSWRLRIGQVVTHPDGRGPLAMAELADRARDGVQALLDEAGR